MTEDIKRYKVSLFFLGLFVFCIFTYLVVGYLKDYDCKDFKTQSEAQAFFEEHEDVYNLDGDGDGKACENLKVNYLKQ